jgi:Ca2+-binding RTX toxin-like protein
MNFEPLESRLLMSVSLANGTLTVEGKIYANNYLAVSQSGSTLTVYDNGFYSSFNTSSVSQIWLKGKDFNDSLSTAGVTISTRVDGGGGDDVITTGLGNDTVYSGAGADTIGTGPQSQLIKRFLTPVYDDNDFVSSDAGNDTVTTGMGNDTTYAGYGDDVINANAGQDWVFADDGNDIVRGNDGDDVLFGNAGHDSLYAGAGLDDLYGGGGNDSLVAIGGGQNDFVMGESGSDSFWVDAESTEIVADLEPAEAVAGHLHRVGSFMTTTVFNNGTTTLETVSRELDGQSLQDPAVFSVSTSPTTTAMPTYTRFSGSPLFSSAGPLMTDIRQGQLGDCYFLAPLSATAKTNPDKIRQSVVDLGDGTFAVQFFKNGSPTYIRVDADLPTVNGVTVYDRLPGSGALWAAVMEKAYAFFRRLDGQYASLAGGTAGETFASLGVSSGSGFRSPFQSGSDFLRGIQAQLDAGYAVTLSTPPAVIGPNLVSLHVYAVDHVVFGPTGSADSIVLRNPWGTDRNGASGDGNDDGFVTVSANDIFWTWVQTDTAWVR